MNISWMRKQKRQKNEILELSCFIVFEHLLKRLQNNKVSDDVKE